MPRATVVELKLVDQGKLVTKARFVLLPSGGVEIVPVEGTMDGVRAFVGESLRGPRGMVTPEDGMGYLDALRTNFQGTYVWATDPREMDMDEALTVPRPTPDHPGSG